MLFLNVPMLISVPIQWVEFTELPNSTNYQNPSAYSNASHQVLDLNLKIQSKHTFFNEAYFLYTIIGGGPTNALSSSKYAY